MLFVECGDKVDKSRQQTGRETFGTFELGEGVVVTEKKSECVDDSQCFHASIVTIFCFDLL